MKLFHHILKKYPNNPDNKNDMFNMWLIIRSYEKDSKRDKWIQTPFHILFEIASYLLYNVYDSEKLFISHLCEIYKRDKCGGDVYILYKKLADYTDGYIPTKSTLNLSIPISKFAFVHEVDEECRVSKLKLPKYLYVMGTTNYFHKAYFRDSAEIEFIRDYYDTTRYNIPTPICRITMTTIFGSFELSSSFDYRSQFQTVVCRSIHSDTDTNTIHSNPNISAHSAYFDGDEMNLDDNKIIFFKASNQKFKSPRKKQKSNFKRQNAIVKRRYNNKNIKGYYRNR